MTTEKASAIDYGEGFGQSLLVPVLVDYRAKELLYGLGAWVLALGLAFHSPTTR